MINVKKTVSKKCPHCGEQLELNAQIEKAFCQYCGTQFVINEDNKDIIKNGAVGAALNFVGNQRKRINDKKKLTEEEAKIKREKIIEFITKYWKILLGAFITLIIIISFSIWSENNKQFDPNKIAINSSSSEFVGKNYENVVTQLKKAGFTNIKTKTLEDLVTGWLTKDGEVEEVKIDEKTTFETDTIFSKGAAIIITYHTFPKEEKEIESTAIKQEIPQQTANNETTKVAFDLSFPVENAKRATVVAITNSYAADVFNSDGNTYDISKFHSYADASGKVESYFFNVTSWGTWSVKDENSCHVDSIILKNILGTVAIASLDVKYDGKNYIVSNVKGTFGKDTDLSEIEKEKYASLFLTISPELIKNDRDQTEVNALDHSGKLDKYVARKVIDNFGKTKYPYGFNCHWFIDLINEEQSTVDGSWFFKVGVEITNEYGTSREAIAECIISGTTDEPIIKQFEVH